MRHKGKAVAPSTKAPQCKQTPIRALTVFDSLPPGHNTLLISDDAPHLKVSEYAVIDTTDRELQNGELYVIQYESGDRRRSVVQIRTGHVNSYSGRRQSVWWVGDLAGFRRTNETVFGGFPVFAGLSDGPYNQRHLKKKLLGRVVGYAEAALGGLLQPCAGWAD